MLRTNKRMPGSPFQNTAADINATIMKTKEQLSFATDDLG
jgi:hypothetical protein